MSLHRACLHGGKLIPIPEENQPGLFREGAYQFREQRQIDHGGLIDHHDIHGKGIPGVMAKSGGVGKASQQSVDGNGQQVRWGHDAA